MSRTESQRRSARNWFAAAQRLADAFAPVVATLTPPRWRRRAGETVAPEQLESRQLMSTVALVDGVLTIDGSADASLSASIRFDARADRLRVFASGADRQSFPRVEVREIRVIGSPGDDRVHLARQIDVPANIQTGDGDDRIAGGRGDDTIDAGAGDDIVFGRNGADTITGGDGNDRLYGEGGNDTLLGNAGDDRLFGGAGHDTLTGGTGFDRFSGGAGNDHFTDRTTIEGGSPTAGFVGPTLPDAETVAVGSGIDLAGGSNDNGNGTNHGGTSGGGTSDDDDDTDTDGGTDSGGDDSGSSTDDDDTATDDGGSGGASGGATSGGGSSDGGLSDGGSDDQDDDTTTTPDDNTFEDPNWGGAFDQALAVREAPTAAIRFVTAREGQAGHTVNVNAMASQLRNGDAIGARYEWDFGDAGSPYNKLVGWTAAHTYDKPGVYTIRLTVTDAGGKSDSVTQTVTIRADARRAIYVDAVAGDDANTGASAGSAVRTLARAVRLSGDDTRILLRRGQTHDIGDTLRINGKNVAVDAYGNGTAAVTVRKVRGLGSSMFYISPSATGFMAQNLVLDSMWDFNSVYGKGKIPAEAFTVAANNFTVRRCAFFNINTGVQTEAAPTGVLVQDNYFSRNIRSYCIWSQGTDHAYLGNRMTDSQQEHLIRADATDGRGITRVLIHDNDLSRPSNRKGSIEIRTGQWFYISGNRIKGGTLRVGLQDVDKKTFPDWASWKCENGVIENNRIDRVFINIRPGMKRLAVRNNVVKLDDWWAMQIECVEPGYDHVRKTEDVRIERNTVINLGATGSFLRLNGQAKDIVLKGNLYVAPNLKLDGRGQSFAVQVIGRDLSSFKTVGGNVWPALAGSRNQDGIHYVGPADVRGSGFRSASEWNALGPVGDDVFGTVPATLDSYQFRDARVRAGASLQKAA